MGWSPCRRCGVPRKEGHIISSDGEHVAPCLNCGDDEYINRLPDTQINWTTMPPATVERIVVWDSATGEVKWDTEERTEP